MTDENRRHQDLEAGVNRSNDNYDDPFYIPSTKNAPISVLRRWRGKALVLNASRRFRYTLNLKREEEKPQRLRKIRAHAQAIYAAYIFQEAGQQLKDVPLGSLARPYFDYIDASCSGFLGAWYKDRVVSGRHHSLPEKLLSVRCGPTIESHIQDKGELSYVFIIWYHQN
ncbi:hypothetical protein Ddye_022083 [Dipteronia dyeriana]|uniref:Calcium-transporting P-type ATPase N-terminal autoinhibitory domain-containing protein n=1 Tax=Dipteronia dyeriana TaxID=168575 RepID=A0AAD9U3I1_9ROSI|nr:hypothetical protein Ddye_022083 [Dipteronia dyeriana]